MKKFYWGFDGVKFIVVLDFCYCRNIWFFNVEILFLLGFGLNCYDCGGFVNFIYSIFVDNVVYFSNIIFMNENLNEDDGFLEYVYLGGGIYLGLDFYGYNIVNVILSMYELF